MRFDLVAYEKLVISIKESVQTLLKHHKLDPNKPGESIPKLPAERSIQAQLLLKTIELLDSTQDIKLREKKALILNAAVYYVQEQIAISYGFGSPLQSDFYKSLTTSLGLNNENNPLAHELEEMYSYFDKFLRAQVYISGDPRKGYAREQPLSAENIKGYSVEADLDTLADTLHKLRTDARKSAAELHRQQLEGLKSIPRTVSASSSEVARSNVTPSIVSKASVVMDEYHSLVVGLNESIDRLIASHNVQDETKLNRERRIQVQFLKKVVERLDALTDKQFVDKKATILKAAIYYVQEQIEVTYQWASAKRSEFFKSLNSLLDRNKDKPFQQSDLIEMFVYLEKFMRDNVYVAGEPRKGYLVEQPFSPQAIRSYSVEKDLDVFSEKLHTMRAEIRKSAFEDYSRSLAEAKKTPKAPGKLGVFGGLSAPMSAATTTHAPAPQ